MSDSVRVLGALLTLALAAAGCEDEPIQTANNMFTPPSQQPTRPAPDAEGEGEGDEESVVLSDYPDETFVELDIRNRDPFRSFAAIFEAQPERAERDVPVQMPDVAVADMRLIAIISGVAQPRAMIQDPQGVGHTVRRGAYIGRSEVVQIGGRDGTAVRLNWRVERIRPGEVVLAREDPVAPDRPPMTRIMTLYDEESEGNVALAGAGR
ncbi:MAG: hypothetical protein AAGH15_17055 [Myxococcota bacterium]